MRNLLRLVKTELGKEIRSVSFYAAIIGYIMMCFIISGDYGYGKGGAFHVMDVMMGLSNTASLLVILAALPSACTFSDDWENGFYKFIVSRSSVRNYIVSKLLICAISTFIVSFFSFSVFGLIEYAFNGAGVDEFYPGVPFYNLIHSEYNILYIFITSALYSVVVCVYSGYGLVGSAIFPNKFVAIACPLISSIIVREISYMINYGNITLHSIEGTALHSAADYWAAFGMISIYGILAAVIFAWVVRRRIHCEIN